MYLDAFLEAFRVSDLTILFPLSLGIGVLPKLGGAIGLDDHVEVQCALGLELCMLDWGGGKGVAELCMLDQGGGKGVAELCMVYQYDAFGLDEKCMLVWYVAHGLEELVHG